jgi:hypothetical protein
MESEVCLRCQLKCQRQNLAHQRRSTRGCFAAAAGRRTSTPRRAQGAGARLVAVAAVTGPCPPLARAVPAEAEKCAAAPHGPSAMRDSPVSQGRAPTSKLNPMSVRSYHTDRRVTGLRGGLGAQSHSLPPSAVLDKCLRCPGVNQ